MKKNVLPLLAVVVSTLALGAYQTPSPYKLLVEKGAYLQVVENQEAKVKAAANPEARARAMQQLAGFYGFVGDYQAARQAMNKSDEELRIAPPKHTLEYPQGTVQTRDAVEEIVRAARGRQIVVLNEAHQESRHRAFATRLALALRKEGFTYFAAETFNPDIAATQKRGYPTRSTGYYVLDPLFGDLVRQVQRVGYKLVAYEIEDETRPPDPLDAINAREIAESRNLIERVFRKDPKARVLVYVGYSHAQETEEKQPDGRVLAWMATRLKKETGIDPLTIEQSELFDPSMPGSIAPQASNPVERFHITRPTVLKLADGNYWLTSKSTGKMDMQVFHPFVQEKQGRPDWLTMDGYRKPFPIKAEWLPTSGRTLLQAFVERESDDAIPVDQTLLSAGKPAPVLMLPKGTYRLVVQDGVGNSHPIGNITQK